MSSILLKSQQILEANEDIIAVIVENLQLGRIDYCVEQYSVLQSNLNSLALELDNYPAGNSDPHESVEKFPDELMRKDILDDFRPPGSVQLPILPLAPPCNKCNSLQQTSLQCRVENEHVDPSCRYSSTELEEFLNVSEALAERHKQFMLDKMNGKTKRAYRRWNSTEKFTLMVAISLLGARETYRISELMEDRSENQIRSFISKNFNPEDLEQIYNGILPPPPTNYQPPPRMVSLFADPNHRNKFLKTNDDTKLNISTTTNNNKTITNFEPKSVCIRTANSENDSTSVPHYGWNGLLAIALNLSKNYSFSHISPNTIPDDHISGGASTSKTNLKYIDGNNNSKVRLNDEISSVRSTALSTTLSSSGEGDSTASGSQRTGTATAYCDDEKKLLIIKKSKRNRLQRQTITRTISSNSNDTVAAAVAITSTNTPAEPSPNDEKMDDGEGTNTKDPSVVAVPYGALHGLLQQHQQPLPFTIKEQFSQDYPSTNKCLQQQLSLENNEELNLIKKIKKTKKTKKSKQEIDLTSCDLIADERNTENHENGENEQNQENENSNTEDFFHSTNRKIKNKNTKTTKRKQKKNMKCNQNDPEVVEPKMQFDIMSITDQYLTDHTIYYNDMPQSLLWEGSGLQGVGGSQDTFTLYDANSNHVRSLSEFPSNSLLP